MLPVYDAQLMMLLVRRLLHYFWYLELTFFFMSSVEL